MGANGMPQAMQEHSINLHVPGQIVIVIEKDGSPNGKPRMVSSFSPGDTIMLLEKIKADLLAAVYPKPLIEAVAPGSLNRLVT